MVELQQQRLQNTRKHTQGGKGDAKERAACRRQLWVYKDHLKLSWQVHRDELSS